MSEKRFGSVGASGLPKEALEHIGTAEPVEEEKAFSTGDMTRTQKRNYAAQREDTYNRIVSELRGNSYYSNMSGETQSSLLSAAATLAEETAKADNSDGQYTLKTQWTRWAVSGKQYGVTESQAILFKIAYDTSQGDSKKNGDGTVSGSRKKNTLTLAEQWLPDLSEEQRAYLISGYWNLVNSDTRNRDLRKALNALRESGWK